MTRPTRTLATLLALMGGATALAGAASAQTYQSPPAHHVPVTSYYGTAAPAPTTYRQIHSAPAYSAPVTVQTRGGEVVYHPAPVASSVSTRTYAAPASGQGNVDYGVTYAPYHGTSQPVYRQPAPAPAPVYGAAQPVQTWVRPSQPVYAPAPRPAPDFAAPAIIGGLFGAAILGSILLNDDDDDHDRRHRGRDHRGDRHDAVRRQDRRDAERRAARQQERAERERAERRQEGAERRAERERARSGEDRAGRRIIREERGDNRRARGDERLDLTAQERAHLRRLRREYDRRN